ncbi:MAG TPA: hypothetical protein VF173_16935 [Thermoanaerobaculia bacterium]|nr:hypothetical protein [Thermoanaerobaculia bacterium]
MTEELVATVKKLAVFCLVLAGAAFPVSAQLREVDLGALADVNGFDPLTGSAVARLADGSYAVAWQGMNQEVRIQWVKPDGSELLETGGRGIAQPTSFEFPLVAAHPVAGAFVAFSAVGDFGSRIVVQSFDGAAAPRWSGGGVAALDSPGVELQSHPQILASPDGGVFVCFVRSPTSAAPVETVCQKLSAAGKPLWSGGRILGGPPSKPSTPRLVADGQGGVLVFWTSSYLASSGGQQIPTLLLQGQRFSAAGVPLWGTNGKMVHTSSWYEPSFQFTQAFAVPDGQGGAILAFPDWKGQRAPLSLGVLAQRISRDGVLFWANGVTIEQGTGFPTLDSLTAAPNAEAYVIVQNQNGLGNGRNQLALHRLGSAGRLPRPYKPITLSVPGRSQSDNGSHGSFDGGRLRILWSSHVLGDAFHVEVRLAVFDKNGKRLTAPDAPPFVAWSSGEGHYSGGFAFDAKRNQGLAVWNTWRNLSQELGVIPEGALFSGNAGVP